MCNDRPSDGIIERIDLGDQFAEDKNLYLALEAITEKANQDASGKAARQTIDLLGLLRGSKTSIVKTAIHSFQWIKERLLNHEIKQAVAGKIDAEASLLLAKATAVREQAGASVLLVEAEAEGKRADTMLKTIRELHDLGIDWRGETDEEGRLRIAFTKRNDDD